jgi:hypothetical protein
MWVAKELGRVNRFTQTVHLYLLGMFSVVDDDEEDDDDEAWRFLGGWFVCCCSEEEDEVEVEDEGRAGGLKDG